MKGKYWSDALFVEEIDMRTLFTENSDFITKCKRSTWIYNSKVRINYAVSEARLKTVQDARKVQLIE